MRFSILLAVACMAMAATATDKKKIVCYLGSWAVYRPGAGKFQIENIDVNLCTHLIYAFVGINGDKIKVLDPWQDLPDNWGKDGFRRFNNLREKNPKLKTLIAVGGWNEESSKFSAMASDPNIRSRFVKNTVGFVKRHKFDGLDLDWEYPAQRGGDPSDVQNFVDLVKELREAFDVEGFLLTAAVAATESSASKSYDIPAISKYLHFINLMTYDLHGFWDRCTGTNAPLYAAEADFDSDFQLQLNVDAAVKYWLAQGAPPEKIIVGTASYGRSFTLADPNEAEIGDASHGPGAAGPYTRQPGMLGYNEICELQKKGNWNIKFDEERRVPYAYNGYQWVGYDNVKSIEEKAEYINKMGLGGAMIWSLDTDDFNGNCGEQYPLLKALIRVIHNGWDVPKHHFSLPLIDNRSRQS